MLNSKPNLKKRGNGSSGLRRRGRGGGGGECRYRQGNPIKRCRVNGLPTPCFILVKMSL